MYGVLYKTSRILIVTLFCICLPYFRIHGNWLSQKNLGMREGICSCHQYWKERGVPQLVQYERGQWRTGLRQGPPGRMMSPLVGIRNGCRPRWRSLVTLIRRKWTTWCAWHLQTEEKWFRTIAPSEMFGKSFQHSFKLTRYDSYWILHQFNERLQLNLQISKLYVLIIHKYMPWILRHGRLYSIIWFKSHWEVRCFAHLNKKSGNAGKSINTEENSMLPYFLIS